MSTIIVWVLVIVYHPGSSATTSVVIDNIATVQECERARELLKELGDTSYVRSRCIQLTKVKP